MLKQLGTFLGGLFVGLLAAGLLLLLIRPRPRYAVKLLPAPTPEPLEIHVAGAVSTPGVVQVAPGSIVKEAIEAAGGPDDDADLARLNLAQELQDGQQVYVPVIAEGSSTQGVPPPLNSGADKININTANEVQLEQLPGIGPSLAASIVEYREQHGWFQEQEELLQVSGIGPAKLDQIADLITLH